MHAIYIFYRRQSVWPSVVFRPFSSGVVVECLEFNGLLLRELAVKVLKNVIVAVYLVLKPNA